MHSEFAIIGMSCYFPGSNHYDSFWHSLLGNNASYAKTGIASASPAYRPEKGVIEHAEYFDPGHFNISEKEAEVMDPQTRKFIELVEQGLADAGYPQGRGLGRVGVIATQGTNHTYHNQVTQQLARGEIAAVNQLMENINKGADFLATRTAYIFDFKGPCFNLQSACSSSLVAVVEACYMLAAQRCEAVIVGGINLSYPLDEGYTFESGSIYSGSGRCKPFDAQADGTIPSNGGGLIVLKPLAAAEAAGDRIHAVITGAQINNDGGQKVSYAAPSTKGQYQLLKDTYQQAQRDPAQLEFIECHATGTVVGDPIEVRAIAQLMAESSTTNQHKVLLGSVKGHIGHLFWSSGIASLIKAVQSLKYGIYPGTAHLGNTNPLLELQATNLQANNSNIPLREQEDVFAAVSSFGVGGTNAHVLLARYGKNYAAAPQPQASTYSSLYPNAKKYSLLVQPAATEPSKAGAAQGETTATTDEASAKQGEPNTSQDIDALVLSLFESALGEQDLHQESNYFDHFGDSVSAVTLIADIKKAFAVDLTQENIFDNPTPVLLSYLVKSRLAKSHLVNNKAAQAGETETRAEPFEFNAYQQRFYLLEKLQRGDYSNYNVSICFDIDNAFPKTAFVAALEQLLTAIPGFSHNVQWRNGKLGLGETRATIVAVEELCISSQADTKQELDKLFGKKFNLETGPSCYLTFIQQGDCQYLVLNTPHLLLDGKGLDNLLRAISDKANIDLTKTAYLPKTAATSIPSESREFWKKMLANTLATSLADTAPSHIQASEPATEANRNTQYNSSCGRVTATIGSAEFQAIRRACEKWRTTSFALLYGFLNFHLYRTTGERRLCIGTTLLNRSETTRDMIGCFVNNIPLVVEVQDEDLYAVLENSRKALSEAMLHAQVPYDLIASDSNRSGKPLYKILFMLQNQNKGYQLSLDGKTWYESAISYSPLYADLSINIIPQANQLLLDITYDRTKYSDESVHHFIDAYVANVSSCLFELEREAYVG